MGIIIIKVPKSPVDYVQLLAKGKIKVIRDNHEVCRPMIYQGDGIESLRNGCKLHVVKTYSRPKHDFYIVVAANKWLSFSQLSVNFSELIPLMIGHPREIDEYLNN